MATQISSDEEKDESSDTDSWAERTMCTDDSIPYEDVVRLDTEDDESEDNEVIRS